MVWCQQPSLDHLFPLHCLRHPRYAESGDWRVRRRPGLWVCPVIGHAHMMRDIGYRDPVIMTKHVIPKIVETIASRWVHSCWLKGVPLMEIVLVFLQVAHISRAELSEGRRWLFFHPSIVILFRAWFCKFGTYPCVVCVWAILVQNSPTKYLYVYSIQHI